MKYEELPLEVRQAGYRQLADDLLESWLANADEDEDEERLFQALDNTPYKTYYEKWAEIMKSSS
jgi:hypothetical protein